MKRNLIILAAFILASTMFAQAQVGIGTTTPNASAALDVQSTTRGVLLPRMTSAQRIAIATPADGLIVYQTDAVSGLWMHISGAWIRLTNTTDLTNISFGTSTGFASNTLGSVIAVILGGTPIPLPSNQSLGSNVTVNGANTVFTVAQAGRYRIAYGINMNAALLVSSQLRINGTVSPAGTVAPVLSVNRLSAEVILNLTAGSTISVELFGLLGAVVLLPSSQGAFMTIQRVE
ncbi:hypothetical protein D3H65_12675 [Paraflavitalea soli]|uniref:BclA C-terminal domain-containing protein n=1 Tax=Paraflavitalea soli TaxID=2315862 RepID=A0A3B7MT18_9BACT|nr:hypothetical protein [Paraflavitalea soli]AXY74785.1 hypothetical protein D3H65_12675 [Paraflavitalea soli]